VDLFEPSHQMKEKERTFLLISILYFSCFYFLAFLNIN